MTDIPFEIAERIHAARGFIFDMDGTLALGDKESGGHRALPGAVEILKRLRVLGLPFRVFTNGTAKPPAAYAKSLRDAGLDVPDDHMMTPSTSAAAWFAENGIRRVRVLGTHGCAQPLIEVGIDVVAPSANARDVEAVYTGWFREFTFPDLEAACKDVWAGARLTTASNVPFFATAEGRGIGSSFAINSMIRAMTGKRPVILGKPGRAAIKAALSSMKLPQNAASQIVVLGDDPFLEIRMARSVGAIGIGVTTGLVTREAWAGQASANRAHHVINGFSPLLRLLESQS